MSQTKEDMLIEEKQKFSFWLASINRPKRKPFSKLLSYFSGEFSVKITKYKKTSLIKP